jgi:hypothetical protein
LKLQSLDWNFTSHAPDELPVLYNYEFSRSSARLREWVKFIRRGKIKGPTYWTPDPQFGWPQWPQQPYLAIPAEERADRLQALFKKDTSADELLALREQLFRREGPKLEEIFSALLRLPNAASQNRAVGRAATKAKYRDELRSLAVYRLREYHSPQVACRMYNTAYTAYGQTYGDVDALEKARRKAHRYLTAFVLSAAANASRGLWFPPFGTSLTSPS